MEGIAIGILIGMPLGIVAWVVGQIISENRFKERNGRPRCYHCGKPPFDEE